MCHTQNATSRLCGLADCRFVPLLVVRHADAVSRSSWAEHDDPRPLSPKGFRQAKLLPDVLADYKPTRIVSSPARRCLDTVVPLSELLGVPVEIDDRLAEGTPEGAIDMVRAMVGQDVALCSHGDIIPSVMKWVASKDKVNLGKRPRFEKASVWVLDSGSKHFRSARYLPPPEV